MEHTKLFIALGSLLLLALILASAVRRYQEIMAERRMRVRRILRGVDLLKELLGRISGCPLPLELERLLHQDILHRLMMVKKIDSRYAGINELIKEEEQVASQLVESQRFDIQDKPHLHKIAYALGEVMNFLAGGRLLTQLAAEQVRHFVHLAALRRSEAVYRYNMERANKLREEGELRGALVHCKNVVSFLKQHGPADDQVKAWFKEAEALKNELDIEV